MAVARRGCGGAGRANSDADSPLIVDQCRDTHHHRPRPPPRGCPRSIISRLHTHKQNKIKTKELKIIKKLRKSGKIYKRPEKEGRVE